MRSNTRPSILPFLRLPVLAVLATVLGGCSLFHSDAPATSAKKGWSSILPWGGRAEGGDATAYIEYQRTRSHDSEPLLTLMARNTHPTKTIQGQMRTTMQTSPVDTKVDSQSFTLAPNEQKRLLVYPARLSLTYEVTASFKQ